MSIGKTAAKAAKAAGTAAGAVGDMMGSGTYPESEYGLAVHLFEKICGAERDLADRDRGYYMQLMYECVRTVRAAHNGAG